MIGLVAMVVGKIDDVVLMGFALLVAYIFSFFGMYLAYRAYKGRGKDDGD